VASSSRNVAPSPELLRLPAPVLLAGWDAVARARALAAFQRTAGNTAVMRYVSSARPPLAVRPTAGDHRLQRTLNIPEATEGSVSERIKTMEQELAKLKDDLRSELKKGVSGNQNQIKGMRGRHRGLEHEIHVAKHLESLGGIAAPSHISVGASKISGGGGEVDLLATLHGGQQYLVEAKARGVDAPPQQTRKNVELLMEHRGEYGVVWAINESASEVKAFIKYVSKLHTALADVSRQGRFRREHTENEYGLILFEKVYGAEPNRNEQWYVKRYRQNSGVPFAAPGQIAQATLAKFEMSLPLPAQEKLSKYTNEQIELIANKTKALVEERRQKPGQEGFGRTKPEIMVPLVFQAAAKLQLTPDRQDALDPDSLDDHEAAGLISFYRKELDDRGIRFFLIKLDYMPEAVDVA
jgi:hypothetical protein